MSEQTTNTSSVTSTIGEEYKIVAHVSSSTAGSSSGDFHVYRNLRRKETLRLEEMDKNDKLEEANNDFNERREQKKLEEDLKVKKKAEQRKKNKQRKTHSDIRKKLKSKLEEEEKNSEEKQDNKKKISSEDEKN
ncbi:hypothetical protein RB653_009988 [Dictyostelium firmibasis]|uniref:Uncharacterized protein n=1 Tax=Dictyostelium firmibasis TaxID=79012 RepID=A0AAN7TSG8_9MYCE